MNNIFLLLSSRALSKFGYSFYFAALPLYILSLTNNLASTGLIFSLSSIPGIVVIPLLGVKIDKCNHKSSILICDVLIVCFYIIAFILISQNKSFLAFVFSMVCISLLYNISEISSKLVFSELIPLKKIENYNGIKSFTDNTISVLAPVLGALTLSLLNFLAVIIVTVLVYVTSIMFIAFICYKQQLNHTRSSSWLPDFLMGINYIQKHKKILSIFILVASLNFFVANSDEIINPGILIQKYSFPEVINGLSSSISIIGNLLAGLFIFKTKRNLQDKIPHFIIANSVLMISIGLFSLIMIRFPLAYLITFLLLEFSIGFVTACVNIPLISYFQVAIPIEYQGRVFSLLTFFSSVLLPVGISYTGLLASFFGADIAYIANNICVICVVIISIKSNTKHHHAI